MECLRSLERQTYGRFSILMVDNGSRDGSAEIIQKTFPQVEVIRLDENLGFAGGFNRGIEKALAAGAEYVLVLNNDTVSAPKMVEELVRACVPGVGVAAPKIFFHQDSRRIWSVGGRRNFFTLEMKDKATGQLDQGKWESLQERDYLTGCAMMIPREVFSTVGLLDEGYFAYYEDMDFSFRVKKAGYKLLLVPRAHLWHKVALTSGGEDSPLERYLMAKGSVLFFKKHGGGWRRWFIIPYRLGSAVKTTFRLLTRRKFNSIIAYWKGLWEGINTVVQKDPKTSGPR